MGCSPSLPGATCPGIGRQRDGAGLCFSAGRGGAGTASRGSPAHVPSVESGPNEGLSPRPQGPSLGAPSLSLPEQSQHTRSSQGPQKEWEDPAFILGQHLSLDSPQWAPVPCPPFSPVHWAGRALWQSQMLRSCWSAAVWPHGATPGAQVSHRGGRDGLFQKPSGPRWPVPGPPEWGGVGVASPSPRATAPGGRASAPQTARGTLSRPVPTCSGTRRGGEEGQPARCSQAWPGAGAGEGLALSLSFLAMAQESLSPAILLPPAWPEGGVFLGVAGPAVPSPAPAPGLSPMASPGRAPPSLALG